MSQETNPEWIPNIDIGQDYDQKYLHAAIHYDALENLALFFGRDMPVHRHAHYLQIHYIDKGDINFHIDDKLFQVAGPGLFLTPPSIPHSFQTSNSATGHVLTVHQSLIWQMAKRASKNELELNLKQGICLTGDGIDEKQREIWFLIQQLLGNIEKEWNSESLAKSLVLEGFVDLLIIQIIRLSGRQVQSRMINNDTLRIFHQFTNQVELHFQKHWQLPQYTDLIGVSESKLNSVCHRISNTSPKKIIRERLLQEIKRLLAFSNLAVNEISYELGFRDPAYFSRFFKEHAGMTPLSYRKQHS